MRNINPIHKYLLFVLVFHSAILSAQSDNYQESLRKYQEQYVKNNGVVKEKDKNSIHFFPVNETYRVLAKFERMHETSWFKMETSGKEKKTYRIYGILHFSLYDTTFKLYVYQSQQLMSTEKYADHLFIPFTDSTSGEESYENGRYIDLSIADIENGQFMIDFNKAYNPYCAYISDVYNCPVPPKENNVPVKIKAGEMKYGKIH